MEEQDWSDAILCRIAYGEAYRWAEARRFDLRWGKDHVRSRTPPAEGADESREARR